MNSAQEISFLRHLLKQIFSPEMMMIYLTAVIAATGVAGWILVVRGADDTKKIVRSAQDQAIAAQNFASTATMIDSAISQAVSKLNTQANQLQKTAKATRDLVEESKTANRHAQIAFETQTRPWLDLKIKTPTLSGAGQSQDINITYTLVNSGKTPAVHVATYFVPGPRVWAPDDDPADLAPCREAYKKAINKAYSKVVFPNSETIPSPINLRSFESHDVWGCVAYQGGNGKDFYYTTLLVVLTEMPDGKFSTEIRQFKAN